ncbi:MAG: M28 family peptidase, partial [Actinobacteria bacterium]|nr:M28 family peptidase [Actinomycetota bacterium]
LLLVSLLLLTLPAAAQAMSFDQAMNKLISSGWAKKMENKCISFKGNPLGYRSGGTASDDACARWIAAEMRKMGLSGVTLEGVPVDEWDFKSASVTLTGLGFSNPITYKATGFGGGVGTPAKGVTGDVVYVKDVDLVNGPWSGSAGAFDAVGDVRGKVVVVDFESDMWWMGIPNMEAGLRGAAAVILTYNPDWPGYFGLPNALAAFDAETDLSAPPMVWLPWKHGDTLKEALGVGPVRATVKLKAPLTLIEDGGMGYNVVGKIKGKTKKNEYVVFGGHHDAWFAGGLDNASSVVTTLVIAKAMKMSHYKPARTMVFLSTTAEEYGITNSWYDWCVGAWHFITQRHPSWAGRIAGMLNTEIVGYKNGNLWMLASPELTPMIEERLDASGDLRLTRNGTEPSVIGEPWCWNDQWTFTAAGVPSVSFWSQDNDYSGVYKTTTYHTQYDTASLISWPFFRDIAKFQFRVAKKLDKGLLPYKLATRSAGLEAALEAPVVEGDAALTVREVIAGTVTPAASRDFDAAIERFATTTAVYDVVASHIPAAHRSAANAQLMRIEKLINTSFTSLDWLDNTTHPFDQVSRDIFHMRSAVDALEAATPDYDTAAAEIGATGLMWYGTSFSEPVFKKILQQHRPTYYHVCWGAQGHLAKYQNLKPEYEAVLDGDETGALGLLRQHLQVQEDDLRDRIDVLTEQLNEASDQIEDLYPLVTVS